MYIIRENILLRNYRVFLREEMKEIEGGHSRDTLTLNMCLMTRTTSSENAHFCINMHERIETRQNERQYFSAEISK